METNESTPKNSDTVDGQGSTKTPDPGEWQREYADGKIPAKELNLTPGRNGKPPPIEHRFSSTYQPAAVKKGYRGPNGIDMLRRMAYLPARGKRAEKLLEMFPDIAEFGERISHMMIANGRLIDRAAGGDLAAIKELHDRLHGRAASSIELSGAVNLSGMTSEELAEIVLTIIDEKGKGAECLNPEEPAPPQT